MPTDPFLVRLVPGHKTRRALADAQVVLASTQNALVDRDRRLNILEDRMRSEARLERLSKAAAQGLDLPRPSLTDVAWRREKGIQEPDYNPIRLWALFESEDTLQAVVTKLATETTRSKGEPPKSWEVVPRFVKRCLDCRTEYEGAVDVCESCGNVVFEDPNAIGRQMLESFFERMNSDVPTDALLEDTVLFSIVLDNWFWWVRTAENVFGVQTPVRVDVLDSRFIRAMTNARGTLGSDEWFCQRCYWTDAKADHAKVFKGDAYARAPCKRGCGGLLAPTAWVQKDRTGSIVGRWTVDEIVHGKRYGGSFRLYGLSRVVAVAPLVETLLWQTRYLTSSYRDRRLWDGILTLPLGKNEGKEMLNEAKKEWKPDPSKPAPLILFTGSDTGTRTGDPKWLSIMGSLSDLAPLDMRKQFRSDIFSNFGVGEVLTGLQTPGQLGHPADALEASYDAIEGEQTHINDFVNRCVVTRFPDAARDWEWRLVTPKQRDEKLDWDIRRAKVDVAGAVNGANVGARATLTPVWDIELKPQAEPPPNLPPGLVPGGSFPVTAPGVPGTRGAKALGPRNLPREDAVPGVRAVEDEFAARVTDVYRRALTEAIADVGRGATVSDWFLALENRMDEARAEAMNLADRMVAEAYVATLEEERRSLPTARFEQTDAGLIESLTGGTAPFTAAFVGFDHETRGAFVDLLTKAWSRPGGPDLRAVVEEMRKASSESVFKLERIARSEMTRVVNAARAAQYEKYADPEEQVFEWSIADDDRVDERCKSTAAGNPWRLEDLRAETNGFLPHPNCRCTVVRRPAV